MTPEEINRAIGEFCGWHRCPTCLMWAPPLNTTENSECQACFPDYDNDLNAMHEAEEKLQNQFSLNWENYWRHLGYVEPHPIFATAPQRAEALLRTIGKWKE